VRSLLAASKAEEEGLRERLREDLLVYHSSFPVIDRLSIFDLEGRERFRMDRQGIGSACISGEFLGARRGPSHR